MDFCGWVNSPPPESGVDWDWLSGESEGQMVPRRDHTTDSSLGHFAFFKPFESNREGVARLESEFMEAVDQACLRIWHHAKGWSINRPSAFTLTVFVNETGKLQPVFNTSGYTNSSWIQDSVDYKASGQHQIILQVLRPAKGDGSFSLDDIHIMRGESCDDNILTTTTTIPPTTTTAPDTTMDCTFEEGLCSWTHESDDTSWTLSNGLQAKGLWNGPLYDHTVGNNQGFFLLLNGSGSKEDEKTVISVPVVDRGSKSCVEFWYYSLGPSVSTLNLLIQTKFSELLVWTRQGTQNSEWMNAKVNINISDAFKIMITGYKNIHSRGFMAVDDITVREGVCSDQSVCGFDSSSCGFENSVDHRGRWERRRATKSRVDHTYGTENGFFMAVMNSSSTQEEVAELFSPEFKSAAEMCARFWYRLPVNSSNALSVHVMRAGLLGDALWQRSRLPTSGWEVSEVTVSSPAHFFVVFRAVHVPGTSDTVEIDDFSVSEGACNPPATCDFESGHCNWVNSMNEDGHDWVLVHGGPNGPPADHTTQTSDGWFLLSSAQHQSQPSVAQVVSEWIHLRDASSCLTFWYHMHNSDSGTLKVFSRTDSSEEALVFHSSNSSNNWSRFSQSLEISKPFQLLIKAESNNQGFIAIDDVSLIPGPCRANETSIGFVGCSFENGTCDWEDVSVGQFQWVRRNATGNTGPPMDNTLGTELGWFVAVEADRGEEMSPAALQSPMMQQASSTCTLHFYYNMNGEESELRVLLKVGPRTTTLLWLSGNHGDAWHHSEVMVGRSPQDFTILFEASRNFNEPEYVALDDIIFTNCSLPAPESWCPDSMFKCNNRVCVDPNQVCDFSDDCGDGSDELSCEKQGVMERCSFEQGFCSWANSDLNPPGADWRLLRGQEALSNHGPRRDHTRNSDAGHYVTPGLHLTVRKQTSEIISKTLLPSINCTVRFFYFSMDDAAATLTAQSMTQMSGINNKVLWVRRTSQSFSWQRAKVTFSTSASSKIVFRYELGEAPRGLVALDDVSFSRECVFDPENSELPDTTPTSAPPTPSSTPTATINPCQESEFFCHHSAGNVCVPAKSRCDYHPDCPREEDEAGCGPCTFESDQCQWTDASDGQSRWYRQKASNTTDPPTDHTTETGFYMRVNLSLGSAQKEAKLLSPPLPPSSPYCQILFHFHIDAQSTGSLRVLMQQAEGGEAILWSCSHNTVSHWASEHLPVGRHQQPYKLWFSSIIKATQEVNVGRDHVVAVDDVSFLNCEQSYQPPDLSFFSCTFEDGLCAWVQGAEEELDWLSGSGPTETSNTGPAGDHTTGKGKYLYIESSHPAMKENIAHLKSPLLPPAGDEGYCFTFWYHMFGATVGSLRMLLKSAETFEKTLVWQKSGDQGDEWLLAQSHVTLKNVHQVVLEATVGGETGDIAIDDVAFVHGPCHASDLCDFEDGSCNWQQVPSDDFDWVRQSGYSTGPKTDHTTSTAAGHYYYLPSSTSDQNGQTASMFSPLYPASKGSCVMLWYYMNGEEVGTLNVYQQSEDGKNVLIFSQLGDQGRLWRFAQASLLPRVQPYKIVVEGVKAGPAFEGGMAFDDVQLTDAQCPPHGFCDFESSLCSWSNLGGVDQGDWLHGTGDSSNPNTGPTFDHTTNSTHGHYVYVDSSVGEWGDMSFLISDVFQPSSRGHCLTFWYHMYGGHIGTLRVYINDRKIHAGGNEEGLLKWIETGNKGDQWLQARVPIKHKDAFWFVFAYQRGMSTGGDVALDDITITSDACYPPSPILPSDNSSLSVALAVSLTLLAGVIISILLFMLNRKCKTINQPSWMDNEGMDLPSGLDTFNCTTNGTEHDSDFSFYNKLYDPSTQPENTAEASSDA
ncbi:MAM and LDL-receptor class A domain-containing protein 1-like [Nothobranchius furzeri]|nr:MAM and LDL-receptor class A domain-containing protein 1-like [Nothobranchius furzeri]